MHTEISISFPSVEAASNAKNALRAAGQHAWVESTDNSSWRARKATATKVVVADHHPEIGSIKPVIAKIIG
jgi:hypothetical protein